MNCPIYPRLWSVWVKTPKLSNSILLIASACLPMVNQALFKQLAENKIVLLACPEQENPAYYGKIASIVRSSRPKKIVIVTIDGSPHCITLHASANEAEYILGEKLDKEHYVVVNGEKVAKISPDSVRVARYLSLVNGLLERDPKILEELEGLSKEYRMSKNLHEQQK